MKKLTITLLIILTAGILSSFVSNYFEITKNLEIFNNIYRELEKSYVENITPGELMEETIDNMLKTLDPWTVYIPESEVEDYRERSITGEYGGIGSKIRKIDAYVVIAEPFKNSPADIANLKIGDKIIEINGESMKDVSTEDVSDLLRGAAGTSVEIKLSNPKGKTKSVTIVREKIKNPTVPYFDLLDNNNAYIRLSQFKRQSSQEVKNALIKLDSLSNNQLNGLILDLRGNPGGLLRECLEIVNLFVPKQDTILTAKGKNTSWNKTYVTKKDPLYENLPIIVLINERSASASEIVAGCLQDLDRGVVIGRNSFGKGLIQQNQKLAYNTQLKLTVAKYYTPSGRCIQNRNYNDDGEKDLNIDTLDNTFFTNNGRIVYDGGGIKPDVEIQKKENLEIVFALMKDNHIFNFANTVIEEINFPNSAEEFTLSNEIYEQFENYIEEDDFDFSVYSDEVVSLLEESLMEENYFDNMKEDIELLKTKILNNKKHDLIRHQSEIKDRLAKHIILRNFYNAGVIEYSLQTDQYVLDAIKLLNTSSNYDSILSAK
ncbi:MAG: peptidase S41 [Flavobacteriales bacterium]|nr:peptidase S41 [Flavobacteriales bacterium]